MIFQERTDSSSIRPENTTIADHTNHSQRKGHSATRLNQKAWRPPPPDKGNHLPITLEI
ncbi:MAG: hypothetical protein RBS40_13240 [Rhodocyclaceae bacterium]|jgi:hypothetical protein|nr:hypothetical protein [Rhodocyclaceae bacterium]